MIKQKQIDPIDSSKMNTLLSNQRTYLSYVRTGLSIIGFAIATHNYFLFFSGGVILSKGVYQYYHINVNLMNDEILFSSLINLYDISGIIAIGCIFYWFFYKDIKQIKYK
jgi:uncharacterized membrane protein YidH (DUF202 family)